MRLAVIADVHGNDLALEAVLADIERLGIREIVNLGDTVSGILNAARTADILMARNIPTVRGNHDRWLVEKHPDSMGAWDRPAHAELQTHHLNWLAALPATLTLPPGSSSATPIRATTPPTGFTSRRMTDPCVSPRRRMSRRWPRVPPPIFFSAGIPIFQVLSPLPMGARC